MEDNLYTFNVETTVSNVCTVRASNEEEAKQKVLEALETNFEDMMECATFDDDVSDAYRPSKEAVEMIEDDELIWGI